MNTDIATQLVDGVHAFVHQACKGGDPVALTERLTRAFIDALDGAYVRGWNAALASNGKTGECQGVAGNSLARRDK